MLVVTGQFGDASTMVIVAVYFSVSFIIIVCHYLQSAVLPKSHKFAMLAS